MRVLIPGGSGFIGGHVARGSLAAGHTVVALGRGGRGAPEGVEFRAADRDDPAAMARVLRGERFDATLDFSGYDRAAIESLLGVEGFVPGRYVFASTGQVCLVGAPEHVPFRESDGDTPIMPEPAAGTRDHGQWVYGVGKRGAEAAIAAARERRGLDSIVLRLPVVWGDGDPSLRMWGYLERMLDGGPVLLPGGGAQPLRFLWVDDIVRSVLELLRRGPLPAPVYHVAQPDIVTLDEVLKGIARAAGLEPEIVTVSWEALRAAGLDRECSPYTGGWVSLLDPGLAQHDWGFAATPFGDYLPAVVRAHLDRRPAESHPGYARRAQEIAFARGLK